MSVLILEDILDKTSTKILSRCIEETVELKLIENTYEILNEIREIFAGNGKKTEYKKENYSTIYDAYDFIKEANNLTRKAK